MRSPRAAALLVAIVLLPVPAFADVTMQMTMATTGGPASVDLIPADTVVMPAAVTKK
jgi:hypothetical protein